VKPMGGSAWPEGHRRRAIATAAGSPETASRLNSGVRKGEGCGQGAWSRSWARDGASAAALVGCSAAGRPVHGGVGSRCGGASRGSGVRAWAAATRWRDEGAGVGGSICRAAATLDVRA
jgi:hypothetical protein